MWELRKNYPREEEDMKCPICNRKEDNGTRCQTAETVNRVKDNTPSHQAEVLRFYRQNKELLK